MYWWIEPLYDSGKEVLLLDLLTLQITPPAPLLTPRNRVGVPQVCLPLGEMIVQGHYKELLYLR